MSKKGKAEPQQRFDETKWRVEEFYSWSVSTQTNNLPFCLAEGITIDEFDAMIKHREKTGRSAQTGGCFRWEYQNGKAWIYELPHLCHERVAGKLGAVVLLGLGAEGMSVDVAPSPHCRDNNGAFSYEPDNSITVIGGGRPGAADLGNASDNIGNRYPNIVFEVAFNESQSHVLLKAQAWLQTAPTNPQYGVQQVIVVKIGVRLRVDGHRTMKAWRYERGNLANPVQEIEFGHHHPNNGAIAPGLPNMQIHVPSVSIFHPQLVPPSLNASVPIDLFFIRDAIERCF